MCLVQCGFKEKRTIETDVWIIIKIFIINMLIIKHFDFAWKLIIIMLEFSLIYVCNTKRLLNVCCARYIVKFIEFWEKL